MIVGLFILFFFFSNWFLLYQKLNQNSTQKAIKIQSLQKNKTGSEEPALPKNPLITCEIISVDSILVFELEKGFKKVFIRVLNFF